MNCHMLAQEVLCNKTHLPGLCKPSRRATLSAEPSDALFVVGVDHAATSQSMYSTITAYDFPKLAPAALLAADSQGRHTHLQYAGALPSAAEQGARARGPTTASDKRAQAAIKRLDKEVERLQAASSSASASASAPPGASRRSHARGAAASASA